MITINGPASFCDIPIGLTGYVLRNSKVALKDPVNNKLIYLLNNGDQVGVSDGELIVKRRETWHANK